MDKYAKIVVISTLDKKRWLSDISVDWFQNRGRLYQKKVRERISAFQFLNHDKNEKFYWADTVKIIKSLINEISVGENDKLSKEYKYWLERFYITLGDFTQQVYLNYGVIKELTKNKDAEEVKLDSTKGFQLDLKFLLQLPFLLRHIEGENEDLYNIFVQLMGLENYIEKINHLERKNMYVLMDGKNVEDWAECIEKLTGLIGKLQKKGLISLSENVNQITKYGG